MTTFSAPAICLVFSAALGLAADARAAEGGPPPEIARAVNEAIRPLMRKNEAPGMAVAVTVGGERYVFSYGVASKETGETVSEDTIFEIGSVSKTFTATLGAYAQESGALSLSDKASAHLAALAGGPFDGISLLDLAAYAAGGLPLQFPDEVRDEKAMIDYFRRWRPTYPVGTRRLYSNPSIGLFGHLAAKAMGASFDALMEGRLFPMLGLTSTFIHVPQNEMRRYAFGYSKAGEPIRVAPGALDSEAYGVKTSAADMIRFVEANMDGAGVDDRLRRAIAATHAGYFEVGPMTQGLGWETYPYPVPLERLLAGNSAEMALEPQEATRLDPPRPPQADRLIDKTGSTNGFGAYVAFVPERRIGVVMLANRNYPIPERVKAAYRILTALDAAGGPAQP